VRKAADAVGYPLLVKAAFGGGGKGMRLVEAGQDPVAAAEAAGDGVAIGHLHARYGEIDGYSAKARAARVTRLSCTSSPARAPACGPSMVSENPLAGLSASRSPTFVNATKLSSR